jgi:integrase/recombinase XerD
MDVAVTIRKYRLQLTGLGYAKSTMELYRKYLNQFSEYLAAAGITDLRTVSRQTLEDYKAQVMAENNSMETKALKLRPVKRLFEYLTENNQLLINPSEGLVETCRRNRKPAPALTVAEMEQLLRQPNLSFRMQVRNRAIMEMLYSTGIRLGELLQLSIHDPDLQDKTLFIRNAKGRKQRIVPLGRNALFYLKEYLEKIRPRYAARNPRERTLFLGNTGMPLQPGALRIALRQYRDQAGIEKNVSPHTFRRTCATHLLQQGADIRHIQELLGHSSLKVTQYYTRVMPTEVKETHTNTHPGGKQKQ